MECFPHKKTKKTVKGMTLIECLIALCVFSIAAAVMVETGIVVNKTLQSSVHLNRKVAAQSPMAETQDTASATQEGFGYKNRKDNTRVILEFPNNPEMNTSIMVDTYSTKTGYNSASDSNIFMKGDLHFVDVDTETCGEDEKGGPLKFVKEIEDTTEPSSEPTTEAVTTP